MIINRSKYTYVVEIRSTLKLRVPYNSLTLLLILLLLVAALSTLFSSVSDDRCQDWWSSDLNHGRVGHSCRFLILLMPVREESMRRQLAKLPVTVIVNGLTHNVTT